MTLKATAARMLGHAVTVTETTALSPNLQLITFEGASLRGMSFEAGMKIKLSVAGVLRSYTPSSFDTQKGRMRVLFHLHASGAAATWAADATPGAKASFLGPARSIARAPDTPWALFFGDETALGLANALATDTHAPLLGAVELAAADVGAVRALGLALTPLARRSEYGAALLEAAENTDIPKGNGVIWLSGHAGSVRLLWDHFLARGVARKQLRVKPYWSEKGTAHRKTVAKALAS